MTGGVRDTLAAAVQGAAWPKIAPFPGMVATSNRAADGVLAALSDPVVVRVATEEIFRHRGAVEVLLGLDGRRWVNVRCCGVLRSEAEHAAHQWETLLAALRDER